MTEQQITWRDLADPSTNDPHEMLMVRTFHQLDERWRNQLDATAYADLRQLRPVLGARNSTARFLILGRDPGDVEVKKGKPFVGETGEALRPLLSEFMDPEADVYWANTVPFKRLRNKPWPREAVQKAFFHPTSELLLSSWNGHEVITLGEHAFKWFALSMDRKSAATWAAHWKATESRFSPESSYSLQIGGRKLTVFPLPHPSKASARYSRMFPSLLDAKLRALISKV